MSVSPTAPARSRSAPSGTTSWPGASSPRSAGNICAKGSSSTSMGPSAMTVGTTRRRDRSGTVRRLSQTTCRCSTAKGMTTAPPQAAATPALAKAARQPPPLRRSKKTTKCRFSVRAGFSRSRAGVGRLKPALTLLLFLAVRVQAQDIPLLDSNNFARGFHTPSMEQAVSWTAAFYDSSHRAIQRAWGTREHYAKTSIAIFDFVTLAVLAMPLSDVWVHEEFHRAVLANRGVASFDDVYRFRLSAGSIAVSHVRDDALVRMKRDHPADLVRAHEAGIEGEAAT